MWSAYEQAIKALAADDAPRACRGQRGMPPRGPHAAAPRAQPRSHFCQKRRNSAADSPTRLNESKISTEAQKMLTLVLRRAAAAVVLESCT